MSYNIVKVTHYNQQNFINNLDINDILIPIGSEVSGSIEEGKVTIRDDQGRIRFQCLYN
jgi:hypothetical protein